MIYFVGRCFTGLDHAKESFSVYADRRGAAGSDLVDAPCPLSSGLAALQPLVMTAATDTGQAPAVADFLLAWWNARACGGCGLTTMWSVAPSIRDDMLLVLGLIAHRREFPTAYGLDKAFAGLVGRWRPGVVQAHR